MLNRFSRHRPDMLSWKMRVSEDSLCRCRARNSGCPRQGLLTRPKLSNQGGYLQYRNRARMVSYRLEVAWSLMWFCFVCVLFLFFMITFSRLPQLKRLLNFHPHHNPPPKYAKLGRFGLILPSNNNTDLMNNLPFSVFLYSAPPPRFLSLQKACPRPSPASSLTPGSWKAAFPVSCLYLCKICNPKISQLSISFII